MGIKSVAIICFDNPFLKPAEGGKIGIMTRLESLSMLNDLSVDVFLLNKQNEGLVQNFPEMKNIRKFYQYKMTGGVKTFLGGYPICTNKRFVPELALDIKKQNYDFAIYEGLQVGKYRFKNIVNAKKHILYFHDIESEYRLQLSKSQKNPVRKFANLLESKKFKKLERQVDKKFDFLWFVSNEECERFCAVHKISKEKALYLPFPASKIKEKIAGGEEKNTILYVGDLTLENNISSLLWFLENVYKKIREKNKDVVLNVVGKVNDDTRENLKTDGVCVLGYVDDIESAYEKACFVASPVLFGAGVKVKIIDALSHGQIVVTTKKGIEGTNLNENHLVVSDDAEVLAEKCLEILDDRSKFEYLAKNALEFITKNHSVKNQADLISETFERLNKGK